MTKRLLDLLAAFFGLLLLSPLFLFIAWRLQRDSPGPVFYRGPRVGRFGRQFHILKFRTMYEDRASYHGPPITAHGDQRITPFGRWLRDTKLNELPQLWNVLLGQMSLVGPRPEDPTVVARWSHAQRQEILSLRPGLTSPASVLYRDEEQRLAQGDPLQLYFDHILPSKLRLDQLYVRHRSFWGDLDIIFWTLLVLVPLLGAVTPTEQCLFLGPLRRFVRRHLSWFLIDSLVAFTAVAFTVLLWRSFGPLDLGWRFALLFALAFGLLKSLTAAWLGVNRIQWSRANALDALDLLPGVLLAAGVLLLFNAAYPTLRQVSPLLSGLPPAGGRFLLPPALLLLAALFSWFGFVLVRYRSRLLTGLASRWLALRRAAYPARERLLIIGCGQSAQVAAQLLHSSHFAASFHLVGFVDDDHDLQGARLAGARVIGRCEEIPRLVAEHDVGLLIFAIHNLSASERSRLLDLCALTPASLFEFPDIPAALQDLSRRRAVPSPHLDRNPESSPS